MRAHITEYPDKNLKAPANRVEIRKLNGIYQFFGNRKLEKKEIGVL